MTTDRDLTRDGVAFSRAVSLGDIDGALAIYAGHEHAEFAVALGALLGGFVGGLEELGVAAGGAMDPWGALLHGAERLET